jgi:hypothetical protein
MRSRSKNGKKKYGPNIVRAWFATIFQYVLGRTETECGYLARRNWSYRFYKGSLDFIVSLSEDMPTIERANLEQFAGFFPEVKDLLERHDRCVSELNSACVTLHEAILSDPVFLEVFTNVEAEAQSVFGVEFASHFGALSDRESFAGLLAEYLVNNLGDLPAYYSTARLWNRFRGRFAPVMTAPQIDSLRLETDKRGQELLDAATQLADAFRSKRLELSQELDVPVAEAVNATTWRGDF